MVYSTISKRNRRFQIETTRIASLSSINNKHGSIITRGNTIYASGYNNKRTKFLGKLDCCQHAEMAAATEFINKYVKCKSNKYSRKSTKHKYQITHNKEGDYYYNLKKFTVWCVRIPNGTSRQLKCENLMSAPCILCLKRLQHLGFGRIAFSNETGNIEIHKLRHYSTTHISKAQTQYTRL